MEFSKEKVLKGVASYRKKGEAAEISAAYGGCTHDGGGGKIKAIADAYLAGLNMQVPEWLARQIEDDEKADLKEMAEYERLKAKFEDRT